MYGRLLDKLYSSEKPLPLDRTMIYAMVRATSKEDQKAVESVLKQFFSKCSTGYTNRRATREMQRSRKISTVRSNAGKQRAKKAANAQQMLSKLVTPDSRLQTPEPNSQDHVVVAEVTANLTATAAAIKSVFDTIQTNPFGSHAFQIIFVSNSQNGAKSWVDVMEHTIQECKSRKVGIPGRFYKIKHVLEKLDAEQSFKRTPL